MGWRGCHWWWRVPLGYWALVLNKKILGFSYVEDQILQERHMRWGEVRQAVQGHIAAKCQSWAVNLSSVAPKLMLSSLHGTLTFLGDSFLTKLSTFCSY